MSTDEYETTRADERLGTEQEIWITTVRADGQPQSSPVGFLWDGEQFVVISQPGSPKVRNVRANPRVALHLDIDHASSDSAGVVTLEGVAALDDEPIAGAERRAYVTKYAKVMEAAGYTEDQLFAEFSTVIRVTPRRTRVY